MVWKRGSAGARSDGAMAGRGREIGGRIQCDSAAVGNCNYEVTSINDDPTLGV